MTTAPHPARWSQSVLDTIGDVAFELLPAGATVLDPFSGVGIERLAKALGDGYDLAVGVELEAEWLPEGGDMVQANSLRLPFRDRSFGALVSSCAYGSRLADSHDAKDSCKRCDGAGATLAARVGTEPTLAPCKACGGSGLSKRNTYKHTLGRDPSPDSSTTMQWGPAYRDLHERVWRECARVLAPGALVLLNVSNHIRAGKEKHVAEWHLNAWLMLGARVHHARRIPTPRLGFGQNGDARVDGELLLVLNTPPA